MNPPPTTAGQNPAPAQTNQNSAELASIKVESRVPQFWADMPRMWFAQFEAVMGPQKQGDAVNFQVAVAKLTKDALQQAADIIMTPPVEKKYEALKKRLLEAFEESAERKFQKLVNEMDLGSQRPSQLLRKMSALAHSTEVGEEVLKRLWIARLPGAIKAVLSVCADTKLEKLTEMADKVSESLQTGEIAAVSTANTPPAGEMTRMIADMAKELKEMRQEELAAATPTQRNWRGILIALLVIAAVLGLIVFSIALLTPAGDGGRVRGRRPTLHDVLTEHYKPFNGTWLTDEELVFRDRWGGLTLFNVKNFTTRLLMNNSTFRELNAVDFKVSADLKFVLLISDVRPGWRHARLARYYVYDVINRNKIPISPIEDDRSAPLLQYAEWSPAGAALVFVHDNDIYYKPKVFKTLVCRITNNGVPGVIFNGVPDFLYETEVLRLDKALWFSPDGQTLMYVTYNDSLVQQHKYPWYGLDQQEPPAYPTIRTLRYPKVNTNNPVLTVNVVSVKTPKYLFSHAIQFNSQVDDSWYVRWTGWTSEKQVAVLLLNRPQNVSIISICSAVHYNCQDIYRDESDGSRWSGLGSEPVEDDCGWCGSMALVGSKATVFTTMPVLEQPPGGGVGGSWRHAVRLTHDARTTLTLGSYEITQLLGWDERRRFLYVIGTAPEKAGERHLYRVKVPVDYGSWPTPPICLTCPGIDVQPPDSTVEPASDDLDLENITSSLPAWPTSTVLPHVADENDTLPTECLYNRITFSKNFSYYVQECLGPGPPAIFVCARWGARRAVLWDGRPLSHKFAALAHPQVKDFRVEVQAFRAARVRLLLPPGFRETDDLPLPLVLHVSAKPGGQLVTERWKPSWGWYLAAARNFIVAEIDARGSGGQGEELRTEIYHKLLSVDVEDQIAVLSYLRDNLKMVDGSRVGVWGRGYGAGAAAALAADDARNVTRCLAAVAPLTDLRHHNSYWTERYSGYGSSWAGALGASAVWRRAGNLPPRRVLLAHAAADLSAPPHHALALARALIRATALYTHQVYPDEDHNFSRSTIHLHKTMEQFFDECFGPVEVADWDTGGVGGLFPFRD